MNISIRRTMRLLCGWGAKLSPHRAIAITLLRWSGVSIGKDTVINGGVTVVLPQNPSNIRIGKRVAIATGVTIVGDSHPNLSALSQIYQIDERPIRIGDDVWIGANAVILPGVTIGAQSVVAAGAVVTKDVPSNSVVGGIPARILKRLPQVTINDDDPE